MHYSRYIHVQLCRFGSDSFTQDSARLTERRKKKKKNEDEQFAWAAISVYHFRNVCPLRQRYFHTQNNRLINPRCLESRETLQQPRSATTSLRVAILIFVDKQAVPATFLDFLQALALQIPSEIAVEMYNSRDMCENSFSHMSSRHLSSRSSLHIIADRQ